MKEAMKYLQAGAIVPVDMETTILLVNALKEALAQPEQEPVEVCCGDYHKCSKPCTLRGRYYGEKLTPKREWVGLTDEEAIQLAIKVIARLDMPNTTKMQLQQQFINALHEPNSLWMLFAAEIEDALRSKNT
jgi:hypothetical protein